MGQRMIEKHLQMLKNRESTHRCFRRFQPGRLTFPRQGSLGDRIAEMFTRLKAAERGGVWGSTPHAEWSPEEQNRMLVHRGPIEDDEDAPPNIELHVLGGRNERRTTEAAKSPAHATG